MLHGFNPDCDIAEYIKNITEQKSNLKLMK